MFCSKCGSQLESTDQFCPKCGAIIGQGSNNEVIPKPEKKSKNAAKGMIAIAIVAVLLIFFFGKIISGGKLSGEYVSDSDFCSIEFYRNGTCVLNDYGFKFKGKYKKEKGGYKLFIYGGDWIEDSTYHIEKDGKDLIITGDDDYEDRFIKQ